MAKKIYFILAFSLLSFCGFSQQLSQVSFLNSADLSYFSFLVDNNVLIRVSDEGKILEWGNEVLSDRYNYYAPKLQQYMGRVEYYGPESDSVFRGKVKSIGTAYITYYGAYETAEKAGKLKSIGPVTLDYYNNYEDKLLRGKMKLIGDLYLQRYSSVDNEACRGKIRSIGNTVINYYSVFDDRFNIGKLKSIGNINFSWYSVGDRPELRGSLKTGNYRQLVGTITYILR